MISLFIDTANSFIISIVKDNDILYYHSDISNSDTSSKVMPIIDEAVTKTNLKPTDINRIYVVNGPGSFTGIRVGVTAAKTNPLMISAVDDWLAMAENDDLQGVLTQSYDKMYTEKQMKEYILKACDYYQRYLRRQREEAR